MEKNLRQKKILDLISAQCDKVGNGQKHYMFIHSTYFIKIFKMC